jgi:hypothetical protein
MFPVPWTPERLAKLSQFQADLQAQIDASIGTQAHDPVKFKWTDGRFEVTFRDGNTYTEMRDG